MLTIDVSKSELYTSLRHITRLAELADEGLAEIERLAKREFSKKTVVVGDEDGENFGVFAMGVTAGGK